MISALDRINQVTKTENGNSAYSWSNDIEELIVQYYFQCVLDTNMDYDLMKLKYENLIILSNNTKYFPYVLKLCLQTRDIVDGKGLYQLTYNLLEVIVFYTFEKNIISKETFYKMLKNIVHEFNINDKPQHSYGSWKDLKLFLNFLNNFGDTYTKYTKKEIIDDIIKEIYIPQMIQDRKNMSIQKPISLCGKWLPRESSKEFKWLARNIATLYYNYVFCMNIKPQFKFTHYRKLISEFNKYLDTTQIHMTSKKWDNIVFNKVTAQTLLKNKYSFLNMNEINEPHRIMCREHFLNFIQEKKEKGKSLKGKNIMPHYLVKALMDENITMNEIDIINLQWQGLVESLIKKEDHFMKKCIPCIDVSPSMQHNSIIPLISAIGMGILTTELSNIKRAFTFSERPYWISFDKTDFLYEKVREVLRSHWGSSTNILQMFHLMLIKCKENKVSNEEMKQYSLIIFSDMQFNETCNDSEENIIETISNKYKLAGYDNIPYLIFWNLKQTNNFPTIEKTPYSTKLSGNSSSLLKIFMNTNLEKIKTLSNISLILEILDNPRYNII